jgi:hypothetical protein
LLPRTRILSVKTHAAAFRRVMSEPKERRCTLLFRRFLPRDAEAKKCVDAA